MAESHIEQRPRDARSPENADTLNEVATGGGKGTSPARGVPPIQGEDHVPGQIQTPAAEDDVGVPEEIEGRTE